MQRLENILCWALMAGFLFIPFLTYEYNEQSPFELPKLVVLSFLTLFVAVGFIWTKIKEKDLEVKWNFVLSLVLVLILAVTLSYQKSNNRFFSFWGNINVPTDGLWSVIICSILAFLSVQLFDTRKKIFLLVSSITLSHIGMAAYGIIQHFGLDPVDWWGYSEMREAAYGTLGQSVAYATVVGVSIPVVSALFVTQKNNLKSLIFGFLLFVLLLGQMYSGSRAPFLLSVINILIIGIITIKYVKNSKFKFLQLAIIPICAGFFYFAEENATLGKRLTGEAVSHGVNARVQVWNESIKIWKKFPFLGAGPENFAHELKKVNEKDFNTNQHWGMYWHKAHNHFFHFLATLGLVGVLAHLAFILTMVIYFIKLFRSNSEPDLYSYSVFENINSKVFGAAILLVPLTIYAANLTAFNFVLTQAYTLIFAAVAPSWLSPSQDNLLKIKFPKYVNALNIIFLTVMAFLFSQNIFNFWNADRYYSLSRKFLEVDRDFTKSMQHIDKAIIYMPYDCRFVNRKALFLSNAYVGQASAGQKFDHSEAVNNLKILTGAAIECNPLATETWYFRGQIFFDLYNSKIINSELIAEESFIESRKLNPANPVITFMLGSLYQKANRFTDFEREMLSAIDLKFDFLPAYSSLIEYYYSKQRQNDIERLVYKIKSIKEISKEMLIEIPRILEIAKKNNDSGNAKVIQETYIRLLRPHLAN